MNIYLPELNRTVQIVNNVESFYLDDDICYEVRKHYYRNQFEWDIAIGLESILTWDNIHEQIMKDKIAPSNASWEEFENYVKRFGCFEVFDNVIYSGDEPICTLTWNKDFDDEEVKDFITLQFKSMI